jgi:O-antigen/teichoic acid export membrane protein
VAGSLLARTARGAGWIVGWRMATRLLGVASTLCLVRLLSPADFGLVALGTGFAQAVDGLAQFGIEDALVRTIARDRATYDTAFTLNLLRALVTGGVVAVAAEPVAAFFAEPRLAAVVWALAAAICLDGLSNIGVVDFRRDFAFHKELQLLLLPRLASIVVAVGIAAIWHSHWALVGGILSFRALKLAASYAMHPFRPRPGLTAWRALVGYSSWTWIISMVMLLRDRVDGFAVGRLLGSGFVGIYAIGAEIAALPTTELVEPLNRAAFSGFSQARRDAAPAGQTYLRVVGTAALLTVPAGIGIALVAEPLVRTAFGQDWLAAVPVVRILGCASVVAVFGNIAMVLLSTHGFLRPIFHAALVGLAARLALLAVLVPRLGLPGSALAVAAAMVAEQGLMTAAALRRFPFRARDLAALVWRPLLAAAAMAALLAGRPGLLDGAGLGLLPPILAGAAMYAAVLGTAWLLSGRPPGPERDMLDGLARIGAAVWRAAGARMPAHATRH